MALGTHILAELNGITQERLNDAALLERTLVSAAQDAGATVVESSFNAFAPHGMTGVIVIQESHLAIHTWPEHGYAALDVFTCSETVSPEVIVAAVAESLESASVETQRVERGTGTPPVTGIPTKPGASRRSVWFTDRQDNVALSLRHAGIQFAEQSPYQKVEVLESDGYGNILLLDNEVAFTERDEFVYHELIAHIPVAYHPSPRRVLIIGGGDGGACREFLKHEEIESITVVEIDPTVTEAVRAHFPDTARCLDDERVQLLHGDGTAFLSGYAEPFDIIAADCVESSGEHPFDSGFFEAAHKRLAADGLLVSQICPPALSPERFRESVVTQRRHFAEVRPYLGYLPTYSTGMVSFLLAGKQATRPPRAILPLDGLRYLNSDVVSSSFALPTHFRKLTEE